MFTIVSLFWLVIGIVNGVILTQRMTPFTVKDLSILDDGITIVSNYMSTFQIVMAAIGVAVAIGLLVLLFIKGPKKKERVKWKRNLIGVLLVLAVTFGSHFHHDKDGKDRDFLRKSGVCLQRLRRSILLYQYLAQYRNKQA